MLFCSMSDSISNKLDLTNHCEREYEKCNEATWKPFNNWMHCICAITFDLELGQALENIYPKHVTLTKPEISNMCYLAFPDSNSGCMGDTNFVVRLPQCPSKSDLSPEHQKYNCNCPVNLQINAGFYWGYVYFRQVKDASLPRGYFQKSVVILSKLPFNKLFSEICCLIAQAYFQNGELSFESAFYNISQWPPPIPGEILNLALLGSIFQVQIPYQNNSILTKHSTNNGDHSPYLESSAHISSVEGLNIFEILQPVLSHIHLLWELVLTCEPIVIMASSPSYCSAMVLALTRIIAPLKYCADYRPYFTIHDNEFKLFTSKGRNPPPVILGVTNPFFSKTLHHWPHTIRLSDDPGQAQSFKLRKNANSKILDVSPGVYTTYKAFLQKDKTVMKALLLGMNYNRPSEVQAALLRRHLLELTQSFMIPLERYIGSLMPLLRNISPFKAAPPPLPFNPDNFFATLESTGPQLTSGIKGDWVGLYKKFFRSPNFNGWFDMRYTELVLKLQSLQIEALSDADLKLWVQGKPEVEIVDMVLKIKSKIVKCRERNMPISETTRERLRQRLQDTLGYLPDDIQKILRVT